MLLILTFHSQLYNVTHQANIPFTATYILLCIQPNALEIEWLAINVSSGVGVAFCIASKLN